MPVAVAAPFCFPFRGIRWVGLLVALAMVAQAFALLSMEIVFRQDISETMTRISVHVIGEMVLWLVVMGPFAGIVTWIRVLKSIRGKSAPLGPPPSEDPKYYPLTPV